MTVSVDAVVYYRVSNATVSVANVENAHHSTRLLAQTTLRNILGTKSLHEILSDRESISNSMQVSCPASEMYYLPLSVIWPEQKLSFVFPDSKAQLGYLLCMHLKPEVKPEVAWKIHFKQLPVIFWFDVDT